MWRNLIPYLEIPLLELDFIKIDLFIVCMGIGVIVAFCSTLNRAKDIGLDSAKMYKMLIWIVLSSFFSAHIFSMLFDFPGRLLENPWEIFFVWAPMSSMGGLLGIILVVFIFSRLYQISLFAYSDALIWGIIPGWIVGRLGCTIVHDHPGIHTTFILGVRYPDGARHDLGLYEFLFTLVILWPLSRYLGKKTKIQGLLTAVVLLVYTSVRFCLDFLRAWEGILGAETRYEGLTATQWVCLPLFVGSIAFLIWVLTQRQKVFLTTTSIWIFSIQKRFDLVLLFSKNVSHCFKKIPIYCGLLLFAKS